jgi:ParB-like chromosome segregation protein Spo0J
MGQEAFKIHPQIRDYIRRESEDELRLLEASIVSEGCRDPLVVWKEENVLVDGHHRYERCERHGVPFTVTYLSFPGAEAAKRWMRANQLARRNLDRQERDQWIAELRAEGWTQKAIADELEISRGRVGQIERKMVAITKPDQHSPNLNKDDLLTLKLQLDDASKREETLKSEIERLRAAEPRVIEKVVEKPVLPDAEELERQDARTLPFGARARGKGNAKGRILSPFTSPTIALDKLKARE